MGLYWEPCPGGARLLRLLGDTPCPAVPGTIEGLPVAELGPYCFADRPVRPGARRTGDDTHEITGNFVEEVTLPDTVRVLDSAAFYNCRRLRRVTLGPGVEGFGSDLFTNCRQLQTFRLRAAADAPTSLKKLLGAVSADITVELDGAQLFYPEYSEFLDENTPAHIFNHSIEGEGYRMRQCFTPGGAVDYAAFDASFAQACVGESADTLCRLALGRLVGRRFHAHWACSFWGSDLLRASPLALRRMRPYLRLCDAISVHSELNRTMIRRVYGEEIAQKTTLLYFGQTGMEIEEIKFVCTQAF